MMCNSIGMKMHTQIPKKKFIYKQIRWIDIPRQHASGHISIIFDTQTSIF